MPHLKLIGRRAGAAVAVLGVAAAGIVTFGLTPAAATTVNDETTFRAAWINPAETQIDLAADITLTCGGGGVAIRNSSTALTLDGHGHTITQTCANNGVLQQDGSGALTFRAVTITGGHTPAGLDGGGIQAGGDVVLDHVVLTANSAARGGGGLHSGNTASITITDSTISNNTSGTENGGGIAVGGGNSVVRITNSTISGNTAGAEDGGGVAVGGGGSTLAITNSTVSGNTAPEGGGIAAGGGNGTLSLVYATVVQNTAPTGANVSIGGPGTHSSFGSVVGLPQGGGDNCDVGSFGFASAGYSFEQGADTCGFGSGTGDVTNGPDPLLAPLASNGGPTETRLPQAGSPLIDAIPTASCQADGASGIGTDQRGVTRPQGAGCDIGAVEVEPPGPSGPTPPAPAAPLEAVVRFTG
jgi:hypothetical protein